MNKNPPLKSVKKLIWRLLIIGVVLLGFLVIYLDAMVKDEFNQQAWNIPAKVYARPLSFSVGKRLSEKELRLELALLGYRQTVKAVNQGQFEFYRDSAQQSSFVINTRGFKFWDGVQPEQILEVNLKSGVIVELKDFASQKMVNFLRLDPLPLGTIQAGGNGASSEDRQLVSLSQLPEHFIPALLNTEDRNYYHHWGISLKGIARAAWSNLSKGEVRQGGSTLTQQLMKNHFLSQERSLWRKLREAILALLTEVHYDKNTILEAYINEVYLGQNNQNGIYGFARASEFYFDKPLAGLNLNQTALLVGMVKGPSLYNPRRNPKTAKKRRDLVLKKMLENGLISDNEYDDAISRTLQVVTKAKRQSSKVPAFMGYIKRELRQEYSLSQLHNQGLRLFTSLDPLVQQKTENSLKQKLKQIEQGQKNIEKLQGAVIVSDIKSGDILAMVGDRNANYIGFNRAVDAYRQTGSVIKPFVYLTALQQNQEFHLMTPLRDENFTLKGTDGSLWSPKNYDNKAHGKIALKDGLIHSYNLATAKLAIAVGIDNIVKNIIEAGFSRPLDAFPSLALGAREMSPLEVLRLYQAIANDGVGTNSTGLIAVQDHQGNLLQRYQRQAESRLEPEATFLVKYLLTEVVQQGTAKSIGRSFNGTAYAGKTGTTNDLRDSWYVGFGGERLAVVWLGRDDNSPTQLTGATGALIVWRDLFNQLNEPGVNLTLPDGLVWGYQSKGFFADLSGCQNKQLLPFHSDLLPDGYKVCD